MKVEPVGYIVKFGKHLAVWMRNLLGGSDDLEGLG
jgi:hypothetical protein